MIGLGNCWFGLGQGCTGQPEYRTMPTASWRRWTGNKEGHFLVCKACKNDVLRMGWAVMAMSPTGVYTAYQSPTQYLTITPRCA